MEFFFLFSKMTFLGIRVRYHFMYQDMVSSAVLSLAKWTFCQTQQNVLHTEIGCAWLCWCGYVQRVHVEWWEEELRTHAKKFSSVITITNMKVKVNEWTVFKNQKLSQISDGGNACIPVSAGPLNEARNESQGTPTWIGISIIIMIMSNK